MKIRGLVAAVVAALAFTAGAQGAAPRVVDGDGGGTPTISVWIEVVWTYQDGYPIYLYCRYASDGNVVWQVGCWT